MQVAEIPEKKSKKHDKKQEEFCTLCTSLLETVKQDFKNLAHHHITEKDVTERIGYYINHEWTFSVKNIGEDTFEISIHEPENEQSFNKKICFE